MICKCLNSRRGGGKCIFFRKRAVRRVLEAFSKEFLRGPKGVLKTCLVGAISNRPKPVAAMSPSPVNNGHEDMSPTRRSEIATTSQSEIDTTRLEIASTFVIFATCTTFIFINEPINFMRFYSQEFFSPLCSLCNFSVSPWLDT